MNIGLKQLLEESRNLVFFGGAGVSTQSGIPDFRSTDGLYAKKYDYPPETILSHSFFMTHTAEFFEFYRHKMLYPEALPNKAHLALSYLEKTGKLKAVITQNIDGLHQSAGSKQVLELHGSVLRSYCMDCHQFYPLKYVQTAKGIPRCVCGGIVKPDVVLYREPLQEDVMASAVSLIRQADLLIVGGTSLSVYPAAGLISFLKGAKLVVINQSPTLADAAADLVIREPISEVFEGLLPELFN